MCYYLPKRNRDYGNTEMGGDEIRHLPCRFMNNAFTKVRQKKGAGGVD